MGSPHLGMGMPTNSAWIADTFRDMQRQITELRAARTLDASTISPGGTLTIEGALVVTGNTVIDGTLSLPAGIIDNAALTSPVAPGIADSTQAGFTLTATAT